MRVQRLSSQRKSLWVWAFILVVAVVVCTTLALDASMTPAERIAPYQQSGMFP
jgi:hypothetical protein